MESWSILERIVRGVMRRRKRLALITTIVALVTILPIAYYASKEPPRFRSMASGCYAPSSCCSVPCRARIPVS